MSRPAKGPRLYLRARAGRDALWVIRDGKYEESTGCGESDVAGAETKLGEYLTDKYVPPQTNGRLDQTLIADVMNIYLKEHGPKTADKGDWLSWMADPIIDWWGAKCLSDIRANTCHDYVEHRIAKAVSDQTARHELKQMSAAIKYYHANYGPLTALPVVTFPPKKPTKEDYFLTRKQAADRIRQARRKDKKWKHVARLILIGVYSGTRPGAAKALRWVRSTTGGWFDLENEILYRAPVGARQTNKRQPKARIHHRLLAHLRRWKRLDEKEGITYVVHYYGRPIKRVDQAWASVAIAAGHATRVPGRKTKKRDGEWKVEDGPHICRHTCATWLMQAKVSPYEAAGFLGMSVEVLLEVYGHHHADFQAEAATARARRRAPETPRNEMNGNGTNQAKKRGNEG